MATPKKGIYRHFKGGRYELIDIAKHSETLEDMVVYRALYGEGGLWVRPLSMWLETVERDGRRYTRFVPEEEYLAALPPEDEAPPPPEDLCPPDAGFDDVPPDINYAPQSAGTIRPLYRCPGRDIAETLKTVFGYDSFRKGQEDIIRGILEGHDTLAVLPTGGGKSLCYQIPALRLPGVTLVISPLISLMKDQVEALLQNGVPCAYLNSSLSETQLDKALDRLYEGRYKLVYVAPERLMTPRFLNLMRRMEVSLIAVDEAHCISQWGQDFRPHYLEIPEFIRALDRRPCVCAYTATATQRVREDICRLLDMKSPRTIVTGFARENLYLTVLRPADKDKAVLEIVGRHPDRAGIIYCATRGKVDEVCEMLRHHGLTATRYHAGLDDEERRRNQDDFINDRCPIIVATNAFGMGIDKSDVRYVIHYNMPGDIESYYQEAGRAGRDGDSAECCLLFEPKDIVVRTSFIEKMGEEGELSPRDREKLRKTARTRLESMIAYTRTADCLRNTILAYFGQEAQKPCGCCENCCHPKPRADVSDEAAHVVRCVRSNRWNYGVGTIIDTLRGSKSERLIKAGLASSPEYGALKGTTAENLRYIIDALCEIDALRIVRKDDYSLLGCGERAEDVESGYMSVAAFRVDVPEKKPRAKKNVQIAMSVETSPSDTQEELFEALRKLRMQLARERHVQPYMVAADKTLRDMCVKKPTSREAMVQVYGMGEFKAQLYGDSFAEVIRAWNRKGH